MILYSGTWTAHHDHVHCQLFEPDDVRQIVTDRVVYLSEESLYGHDDPLFPKTGLINGEDRKFKTSGLLREH